MHDVSANEDHRSAGRPPAPGCGVVRYRVWPARVHLGRTLALLALGVGLVAVGGGLLGGGGWFAVLGVAVTGALAAFLFPTEVVVDGGQLVVRQFGIPRSYGLSEFIRLEVVSDVVARVELSRETDGAPLAAVRTVALPLPEGGELRARLLALLEAGLASHDRSA